MNLTVARASQGFSGLGLALLWAGSSLATSLASMAAAQAQTTSPTLQDPVGLPAVYPAGLGGNRLMPVGVGDTMSTVCFYNNFKSESAGTCGFPIRHRLVRQTYKEPAAVIEVSCLPGFSMLISVTTQGPESDNEGNIRQPTFNGNEPDANGFTINRMSDGRIQRVWRSHDGALNTDFVNESPAGSSNKLTQLPSGCWENNGTWFFDARVIALTGRTVARARSNLGIVNATAARQCRKDGEAFGPKYDQILRLPEQRINAGDFVGNYIAYDSTEDARWRQPVMPPQPTAEHIKACQENPAAAGCAEILAPKPNPLRPEACRATSRVDPAHG